MDTTHSCFYLTDKMCIYKLVTPVRITLTAHLHEIGPPKENLLDRWFGFMVFNVTFNNISAISWRSVLLVEETGVPVENH